jgi:hypothetical protein
VTRRRAAAAAILVILSAASCRRERTVPKPPPLAGDAVWFADGMSENDPGIEDILKGFHCSAVFLPARELVRRSEGWSGADVAAPAKPTTLPVVLVVSAAEDPLADADEKRGTGFGGVFAREIGAALARESEFGAVRGVHLDVPFSEKSAKAYGAALLEARARLSNLLSRSEKGSGGRDLPLTISMRRPISAADEDVAENVRALVSRTDGVVAFVFGEGNGSDPAYVDSLGKPWWAGYSSATTGVVQTPAGNAGARVPESLLDALADDPRTELLHALPWNEEGGWKYTLRATRPLTVGGTRLSTGDSVVFSQPSLADMLAAFRADTKSRRNARGRVVVFGGGPDADRLFPVAALGEVIAGGRAAPQLRPWVSAEARLVRVGLENPSPNASVVSRVQTWIEVDVSPARIGDVEPGGFERWEAYDDHGRLVSPGRATRVRLYETLLAPYERLEPARLRARGKLPAPCCRVRAHTLAASGGEESTDWGIPERSPAPTPTAPPP